MSSTFDQVATIIAETCDIPRDTITPESHAIDDLGIDSLDFLDIAFAIDKAFGIKLPLEKWTSGSQRRQGDHRTILRPEEPQRSHRRIGRGKGRVIARHAS